MGDVEITEREYNSDVSNNFDKTSVMFQNAYILVKNERSKT